MKFLTIILLTLVVSSFSIHADEIVVLALFKNKVVLKKNGKRLVLNVGEISKDGIEVIEASSQKALLSVGGVVEEYTLGMQIQTTYVAPSLGVVHIPKDPYGMYRIEGAINGQTVEFLVDTGASMLAMNTQHAISLQIDYKNVGKPTIVETAGGQENAFIVNLRKVSVGNITVQNINALVVDGDSPKDILLGMTFLNRVDIQDKANVMQLQEKY